MIIFLRLFGVAGRRGRAGARERVQGGVAMEVGRERGLLEYGTSQGSVLQTSFQQTSCCLRVLSSSPAYGLLNSEQDAS